MITGLPGLNEWIKAVRAACCTGADGQRYGSGSSEMKYPATFGSAAIERTLLVTAESGTSHVHVDLP